MDMCHDEPNTTLFCIGNQGAKHCRKNTFATMCFPHRRSQKQNITMLIPSLNDAHRLVGNTGHEMLDPFLMFGVLMLDLLT